MRKDKKKSGAQGGAGASRDETKNLRPPLKVDSPLWARVFVWCVLAAAGVLALWGMTLVTGQAAEISRFAEQGWGQHAAVIVGNKIQAIWHAAFMTSCAGVGLWLILCGRAPRWHRIVPWALVLLVAIDAWVLSRHYIKTMPMSALAENPVISLLKKDTPEHRVALISQEGFYNWWLTYLFPYYDIKTVNVTQMPRMPADYKNFLGAVGGKPVRYWQLAAVGCVLSPASVWAQIQKDPAMQGLFECIYTYNVVPAEEGVTVIPATATQPGQHVVLRLKSPAPRFALIAGWKRSADEDSLQALASPTYPILEQVLIPPEFADALPGSEGRGIVGSVKMVGYRSGFMRLATESAQAAVLRVSEKYDKDWKATVDGAPARVMRVDYLFQGVYLPAGTHSIVVEYLPSRATLWAQVAGFTLCALAGVSLAVSAVGSRIERSAVAV